MSYHGFGQAYPQPITDGLDPVTQPVAPISPMSTINVNPMIPQAEYQVGSQALQLEMLERSGQAASAPPTGPTAVPLTPDQVNIAKYTDEQLFEMMVTFWQAILAGKDPPIQPVFMDALMQKGKGYIVGQAEEYVMSGGKSGGMLPAGIAPTAQPAQNVTAQANILPATQPGVPVTNTMVPTQNITTYVPETQLNPAQPETRIPAPTPPPPTNYDYPEGAITGQTQNVGPIAPGTPSTGTIPQGEGATAPIPQGQLPPGTPQYIASPYPQYAPVPATETTNWPLYIAIGVGAFLLAKMLKD